VTRAKLKLDLTAAQREALPNLAFGYWTRRMTPALFSAALELQALGLARFDRCRDGRSGSDVTLTNAGHALLTVRTGRTPEGDEFAEMAVRGEKKPRKAGIK
jgi:hypothetical protein